MRQLDLFPWVNPMPNRVGPDFFDALPAAPGVYRMFDAAGRVLYVGESGNLRQRVGAYRYLSPGNAPRRLLRLMAAVDRIEVEVEPSKAAARLRENALIREHRPRFNRANTHPESQVFVRLEDDGGGCRLAWFRRRLDETPHSERGLFGAFPGNPATRAVAALHRLAWWNRRPRAAISELPVHLTRQRPPAEAPLALPEEDRGARRLQRLAFAYFRGESPSLVHRLAGQGGERLRRCPDRWLRAMLEEDAHHLESFYHRGPERNARLRREHGLRSGKPVRQDLREDLLARESVQRRFPMG